MTRSRLRVAVLLCPLAAAAAGFLAFAIQAPRFRYPLDYGEGMILDEAWLLAEGQNIYPPAPASPPYLIPSYPPLLMVVEAPFTRVFGRAYWYGRLIAQISAVVAACALGLVVGRLTRSRSAGAVTALTVIAIPAFSITSQFNRVDTPALALAACALAWMTRPVTGPRLLATGALLLAAGFTRQTAWVPAGLAIVAHLAARGERRQAVMLAGGVAAAALLLALALEGLTGGFLFAVLRSGVAHLSASHGLAVVGSVVSTMPMFLAALATAVIGGIRRRTPWAPLLTAYSIGVLPELIGSVNVGSSANYAFGLAAATAMGVGCAWSLCEGAGVRNRVSWACTIVLAAQAAWVAWLDRPFRLMPAPYLAQLEQSIERADGPVLAHEMLGLLPLAGTHVWIEPFKMSELARLGRWDERPFVADLEAHRFALILLQANGDTPEREPWTRAAWDAIRSNYRPCGGVDVDASRRILYYRPAATPCPSTDQ